MQTDGSDVLEFTDEQLCAALKQVGSESRQAAFAAGTPVLIVAKTVGWWNYLQAARSHL